MVTPVSTTLSVVPFAVNNCQVFGSLERRPIVTWFADASGVPTFVVPDEESPICQFIAFAPTGDMLASNSITSDVNDCGISAPCGVVSPMLVEVGILVVLSKSPPPGKAAVAFNPNMIVLAGTL